MKKYVFVTKYWESSGIQRYELVNAHHNLYWMKSKDGLNGEVCVPSKYCHWTAEDAAKQIVELRKKKIKSLKSRIAKMEKMDLKSVKNMDPGQQSRPFPK